MFSLPSQLAGGGGEGLEVEAAAGAAGSVWQTQLGTKAEDAGQGLSGLERGDNDLVGGGRDGSRALSKALLAQLWAICACLVVRDVAASEARPARGLGLPLACRVLL